MGYTGVFIGELVSALCEGAAYITFVMKITNIFAIFSCVALAW